jgi:N6-adenosine-specific RNA methylase IME4
MSQDKTEQALVLREQAANQLAQIKSIESGKEYLSKVRGIQAWAKAEKQDAEMQALIAEQKLRTQRILGQLIKQGQEVGEIKTPRTAKSKDTMSLDDLGIEAHQSKRWQQIASIPEPAFNEFIETKKAEVNEKAAELTTAGMLKFAKQLKREEDIEQQRQDIERGIEPVNGLFDVVAMDPPWPYGRKYDPETSRVANPYPEMSIEEISAIEVPCKGDSVLLLWTTHMFLPDAFGLLRKWGFDYKATLVWNKEKMGMGHWVRMQCEFCLIAVKGRPYWQNTKYRDILNEPRREHSRKPDAFFEMINEVTHGSRLEYFSREQRENWHIYGNDTEKF